MSETGGGRSPATPIADWMLDQKHRFAVSTQPTLKLARFGA
jgi:hypothetical protein